MRAFYQPWKAWGLVLGLFLLAPLSGRAQNPLYWQNALVVQGATDTSAAVAASANGCIAGSRTGGASEFGTITLPPTRGQEAFIAQAELNGGWRWAVPLQVGPGGTVAVTGITSDYPTRGYLGNVYVGGWYDDTLRLGTTTLLPLPPQGGVRRPNAFLASLDSLGNWRWAISAAPTPNGSARITSLTSRRGDALYLAGEFTNTLQLGAATLTAPGPARQGFVARLTVQGQVDWLRGLMSTTTAHDLRLTMGRGYELWIAAAFRGQLTLGAQTHQQAGPADALVVAVLADTTGQWRWSRAALPLDSTSRVTVTCIDHFFSYPPVLDTPLLGGDLRGRWLFGADTVSAGTVPVAFLVQAQPQGWASVMTANVPSRINALVPNALVIGEAAAPGLFGGNFPIGTDGNRSFALFSPLDFPTPFYHTFGGPNVTITCAHHSYDDNSYCVAGVTDGPGQVDREPLPAPPGPHAWFGAAYYAILGLAPERVSPPFHLFPNPAHGTVRLTGLPPGATTAHLIDALGRVVRTIELQTADPELPLTSLPPGLYVVRTGGQSRRLVVE